MAIAAVARPSARPRRKRRFGCMTRLGRGSGEVDASGATGACGSAAGFAIRGVEVKGDQRRLAVSEVVEASAAGLVLHACDGFDFIAGVAIRSLLNDAEDLEAQGVEVRLDAFGRAL